MANAASARPMTTDEFLKVADEEGVTRELIYGQLRERPLTIRSPLDSVALVKIGSALLNWLDSRPDITGVVGCGEARCRLATGPDLIVGIDIVYYEGADVAPQHDDRSYFDGPPVVAVEVLSPSDTHEGIVEKTRWCLSHGTKQVWIADPDLRTVTVHRADASARLFNADQELPGDPELPGFRAAVKEMFGQK